MIPKIEGCVDVIAEGVEAVVIINGKVPHSVLLELFTEHGAGTLIERRRPSGHRTRQPMTRAAAKTAQGHGFDHVETWVFDLDNTLYPAECDLFAQIDHRMGAFIAETLRTSRSTTRSAAQALLFRARHDAGRPHAASTASRRTPFSTMSTTSILPWSRPRRSLARPSMRCRAGNSCSPTARASMPKRVTAKLGVLDRFEDIFDIHALEYLNPKPYARRL